MNGKLTIGQYYPGNSYIHILDPRVKLFAVFVYIFSLFSSSSPYLYIVCAIALFIVIYISAVPIKMMLKGLKSIFFIMSFTVIMNVFFTPGETLLFSMGFINITVEGIILGIKMAVRLVLLVMASSVLTLTTTPISLSDAIEFYLRPFKKIGVPAEEISMMMTIALRFIPTLLEEMDKIIKAQIARGADFDTGGIVKKAKALVPLLVPLFISSLRRAEELALAMEARCYRTDISRTKLKELKLSKCDYLALIYIALFIVAVIVIKITGISFF